MRGLLLLFPPRHFPAGWKMKGLGFPKIHFMYAGMAGSNSHARQQLPQATKSISPLKLSRYAVGCPICSTCLPLLNLITSRKRHNGHIRAPNTLRLQVYLHLPESPLKTCPSSPFLPHLPDGFLFTCNLISVFSCASAFRVALSR